MAFSETPTTELDKDAISSAWAESKSKTKKLFVGVLHEIGVLDLGGKFHKNNLFNFLTLP